MLFKPPFASCHVQAYASGSLFQQAFKSHQDQVSRIMPSVIHPDASGCAPRALRLRPAAGREGSQLPHPGAGAAAGFCAGAEGSWGELGKAGVLLVSVLSIPNGFCFLNI